MGKFLIVGIIASVVLIETGLAFWLIPSSDTVSTSIRESIKNDLIDQYGRDIDLVDSEPENNEKLVEKELGIYDVTITDSKNDLVYAVDCNVVVTVAEDDRKIDDLLEKNQYRIREKIMIQFRAAKIEDLVEKKLGLIKERIKTNINALLPKEHVKEVFLPDFNYYQQ